MAANGPIITLSVCCLRQCWQYSCCCVLHDRPAQAAKQCRATMQETIQKCAGNLARCTQGIAVLAKNLDQALARTPNGQVTR